jgi:hypothetical protein
MAELPNFGPFSGRGGHSTIGDLEIKMCDAVCREARDERGRSVWVNLSLARTIRAILRSIVRGSHSTRITRLLLSMALMY